MFILLEQYIHKVNGIKDKTSLSIVIPTKIVHKLKIHRGDFVNINADEEKIFVRKVLDNQMHSVLTENFVNSKDNLDKV